MAIGIELNLVVAHALGDYARLAGQRKVHFDNGFIDLRVQVQAMRNIEAAVGYAHAVEQNSAGVGGSCRAGL